MLEIQPVALNTIIRRVEIEEGVRPVVALNYGAVGLVFERYPRQAPVRMKKLKSENEGGFISSRTRRSTRPAPNSKR